MFLIMFNMLSQLFCKGEFKTTEVFLLEKKIPKHLGCGQEQLEIIVLDGEDTLEIKNIPPAFYTFMEEGKNIEISVPTQYDVPGYPFTIFAITSFLLFFISGRDELES